jgi:hypothetical protein
VGVAHHHSHGLPSADLHQGGHVAVRPVVPSCPGVATIVRVKVLDPGAPACCPERGLDPRPRGRVRRGPRSSIGSPVMATEHLTISVRQVGQRSYNTRVERHASRRAILGFRKRDMRLR